MTSAYNLGLRAGFTKSALGVVGPSIRNAAKAMASAVRHRPFEGPIPIPKATAVPPPAATPPVSSVLPPEPEFVLPGIPRRLKEQHGPGSPLSSRALESLGRTLYGWAYHLDPKLQAMLYRSLGREQTGKNLGAIAAGVGLGVLPSMMSGPEYPDLPPGMQMPQ